MDSEHRILVTGGAGFIGSHLAASLAADGYPVTVLDNLSSASRVWPRHLSDKVDLLRGDICNPEQVKSALGDAQTIFHLAAAPDVRQSHLEPGRTWHVNVEGTKTILEVMRIERIFAELLFFSSSTVYGRADNIPTNESYGPLEPISVYGASKLASEAIVSAYAHCYGFKAASIRPANIVGGGSSHGIIHDFVDRLRQDSSRLEILGDGTQSKSYLHVDSCIDGVKRIWRSLEKPHDVFNIGSEDSLTVDQIASVVISEMGLHGVELEHLPSGPEGTGWIGDVKNMQLDIGKAKRLGFRPSSSMESVRRAIRETLSQYPGLSGSV